MNSKQLGGVLALALLFPLPSVFAQKTEGPTETDSTAQRRKAEQELERKALILLDEVIKDAQAFRIPENRLRLKALAASMLWKHDAPRARTLFRETLSGIVDLFNSRDKDESQQEVQQGAAQLRRDVVQMLATRDARMARDFLRATRQASAGVAGPYNDIDSDLQLEYRLATQITETDPKQALELAEESLSKGYSYELVNTLRMLRQKDAEAATKLAGEIVSKLRAENLTTNQQAANVALNLLALVIESEIETEGKETKKTAPLLEGQTVRDLVEMNVTLALSSPAHLQSLERFMPQVQKYAPGRVPELRRRLARQPKIVETEGVEDEVSVDWAGQQELIERGTAEELLAAAGKAPEAGRANLYHAAAVKFADKGDMERARDIINSNISNEDLRKNVLADFERRASLSAAEQGKMEQFRKTLATLRTNEERAQALAQIATALTAKGEKKIARQLLDEASELVNYRAKTAKQMAAQLLVAQAYAKLQPERSLAILEPIIDQLNELLAAAATLGAFILDEEMMRDDEIRLEVFTAVFPLFSGLYTEDLNSLARFDFDRTRALADRFQRDEVRMMARLLILQTVLGDDTTQSNPATTTSLKMTSTTTTTEVVDESKEGAAGTP